MPAAAVIRKVQALSGFIDFDAVPDMYGWTKKNADIFGEWTGIEITYKGSGKKVTKQSVKMNTSLNKTKKITLTLGD